MIDFDSFLAFKYTVVEDGVEDVPMLIPPQMPQVVHMKKCLVGAPPLAEVEGFMDEEEPILVKEEPASVKEEPAQHFSQRTGN